MTIAPPFVPSPAIIALVGEASFQRGTAYARNGRVVRVSWLEDEFIITGMVRGSQPYPYEVDVCFDVDVDNQLTYLDFGTCTCPLGGDCKHVAAVLIESNTRWEDDPNMSWRRQDQRRSPLNHSLPQTLHAGSPPPMPEWKSRLRGFSADSSGARTQRGPYRGQGSYRGQESSWNQPTPLALGFQLQTKVSHGRYFSTMSPMTREELDEGATPYVALRPLIPGKKNNWIKGSTTWNSVIGNRSTRSFDPEQVNWFIQFFEIHRSSQLSGHSSSPSGYFGSPYSGYHSSTDTIELNDFDSPLLWSMFDWSEKLEIPLVGMTSGLTIRRAATSRFTIDMHQEPTGLQLRPEVVIDDHSYPAARAQAIGSHGFYGLSVAPKRIELVLVPTDEPLTPEQRELLEDAGPIEVPEPSVAEFLKDYYPRLHRSTDITSDDSVKLPTLIPARLRLEAEYGESNNTVALNWSWQYFNPKRKLPLIPLHADDRETQRERSVLNSVRELWPSIGTRPEEKLSGYPTADFTTRVLPALEDLDTVDVTITGTRAEYEELTAAPNVKVSTSETDATDWFDLGFEITIDGRLIPFVSLFRALAAGDEQMLLDDGTFFSLDHPAFDQLRDLLAEAEAMNEWSPEHSKISRYQADLWAQLNDLADETEEADQWQRSVRALSGIEPIAEVAVPAALNADLRDYQVEGFRWLAFLHAHGLGGILADDMGLGKTMQTLALIAHAKEAGQVPNPFLVVAPTSVVANWELEARKFSPDLDVAVIAATTKKRKTALTEAIAGADLVVTSYAIFRIDAASFGALDWAGLILDEAQFVKNSSAKANQVARSIHAPFRLAITGTPMENSLTDLWALSSIATPGLFYSKAAFRDDYVKPIESGQSPELMDRLRSRIRPFMLRRTKELVAGELPAKQEQVLAVELESRHRKLYDVVLQRERKKLLGLLGDLDGNRFVIFRSLTLLRMLALDPAIVDIDDHGAASSKLNALLEHLDDVSAEGHRALVFSQFTSFLSRIADHLDERGIDYVYLDGSTRNRTKVIESFRTGTMPVFLISLKAGGFGLTLTEADYVFIMDPWWNPAVESQAVDRTHRIGQTKNVMVYRLVAEGTIEEKVVALQQKKAELFSSLMDNGEGFSAAITADDIRAILEP